MLKQKSVLLVVSLALFVCPSVGFGQESYQWSKDKVYVSLNTGTTLLSDVGFNFTSSSNYAGITSSAGVKGDASYDAGLSISGAVGYVVSDLVRTELEFGYTEFDHDKAKGTASGTYTAGGTTLTASASGEVDVNGDVEAFYGMANVILTPFRSGNLTPLVGGGIGFVGWEDEIKSIVSGGTTLTVNGKEDDTDLLVLVLAGLEYNISNNFSASARYRHFWADSGKKGVDDANGHNIVANLTYNF